MSLWAAAWSPAHLISMYVPSSSPTTTEAGGWKKRAGSLNKTGLDGALWSHIPFILGLIFVEHRQQTLQRQGTFLQASSDLRLGCPHCTPHTHSYTHTHTHRAVQTHFYPLLPLLTYQCRSEERSLVCILCVLLFTNNFISGCFSISTYSVVTDSFATREQQTLIFYWLQWCTCSFLWVFLSFSVTFSFLNDPYAQGVRRGQDFSIGTEGVWLIIISKRAFALNRQFVIMFLFFISIT